MSDDQRTNLLVGLARYLEAQGVGQYAEGEEVVAEGDTAITVIRLPEAPTRIVNLRPYDADADPKLSDSVMMLQVRTRGGKAPLEAYTMANAAYAALHGATHLLVDGGDEDEEDASVMITQIYFTSEADIGPDVKGRFERSTNYAVVYNSDLDRLE